MYSAMNVFPVPLSPCKTIGVAAGANTWDRRSTSAMARVSATGSSAGEVVGGSAARSACVARMVAGIRLKVEHGGRARHFRNTRAATNNRTSRWHALPGRNGRNRYGLRSTVVSYAALRRGVITGTWVITSFAVRTPGLLDMTERRTSLRNALTARPARLEGVATPPARRS